MTTKRRNTPRTAARVIAAASAGEPKVRVRSSDAGEITSKPMLLGYARVSTVDQNLRWAFDNGRFTPKTGRSRRVSAWRRAAAVRRFRTFPLLPRSWCATHSRNSPARKGVETASPRF